MLIFSYGTLMSGLSNNHYLSESEFKGRGTTAKEYSLYCRGIPYVSKEARYQIQGELWEVPAGSMRNVDALEGHPHAYKREKIPVILEDGTTENAYLYFYTKPPTFAQLRDNGNYREYVDEARKSFI